LEGSGGYKPRIRAVLSDYLSYPERLGGASPPRGVMELGFRVFGSREDLLEVFIVLGVLQDFCYI